MVALVQIFFDVLAIFWDFVEAYMIPADAASVNILHVAIWLPVVLGLVVMTIGTIKSLWGRGGKRR